MPKLSTVPCLTWWKQSTLDFCPSSAKIIFEMPILIDCCFQTSKPCQTYTHFTWNFSYLPTAGMQVTSQCWYFFFFKKNLTQFSDQYSLWQRQKINTLLIFLSKTFSFPFYRFDYPLEITRNRQKCDQLQKIPW